MGEKKSERPIVNQTRSYRLRPPLSCKVVGWGRLHWTLSKHRCLCRLQAKCVHMCGIKEFVTIHDSDDEILFFTLHDCRRGKESFIVEDEAMIRKREIGRQLRDMVAVTREMVNENIHTSTPPLIQECDKGRLN